MSESISAWDLTRLLSVRGTVHVMKRDAYGAFSENSYPGRHRVSSRPPTVPWCIDLADENGIFRLLCFDFDGKSRGVVDVDLMEQAVDDCDSLARTLDEVGIAHLVAESSGTGGRHIWVALSGAPADDIAALARAARANFTTLDHGLLLNKHTGAARPPLSPHRDGSNSRVLRGTPDILLTQSTTTAEITRLTAVLSDRIPAVRRADSAPSGPVDHRHRGHRRLSAAGTAHMGTIRGGGNPSWTGFMCLLSAANAGWTWADVIHASKTAPGMEHYRTKNTGVGRRTRRSPGEAAARLERQWAKAQQYAAVVRPLPTPREPRDLTELNHIVTAVSDLLERFRVNPGRWGRTEGESNTQSILTALCSLSLHTGKRVVAASIRDLALMTGLGRTTAARALITLRSAGFIRQAHVAVDGNAGEWELTIHGLSTAPGTLRSQPLNNPRPPGDLFITRVNLITALEQQLTDGNHDLFTRQGLGHQAGKLFSLLRQHTQLTGAKCALLLGISLRHATTILSRLKKHKLIKRTLTGWSQTRRDNRDQAAHALGVSGILTERARRYQTESEAWAWWQAEIDRMHTTPRQRSRRRHVSSRALFEAHRPGERSWPAYPRTPDGRGDHQDARHLIRIGALTTESRWQYGVLVVMEQN